jgi:hypothetical protein
MKNPRSRKIPAILMAICLCSVSFSNALAVDLPNKKEIITRARDSYYNLRTMGMASFRCDLTPNWDDLMKEVSKLDPATIDKAVKTLSQIHFSMTMDSANKVQITHTAPAPENAQMAAGFEQIFGGMNQMISSFFDTAAVFVLNSPFPDVNSDYQLEDQAGNYRLSYKNASEDVMTIMDKDLTVISMSFTTPDYTSVLEPQFLKNPKGLLLAGYAATYKSKNPAEDTVLSIKLVWQDVGGLQLLQKLNLSGSYGGSPFAVEVTFSGYQITKK